jgi:RNA polymerase sigma-70 factor (sigma-E family)
VSGQSGYEGGAAEVVERTLTRLRRIDTRLDGAVPQQTAPPSLTGAQPSASPASASRVPAQDPEPPQAPKTLADLYAEHRMRLVRLAILLVDEMSTAEDVVQEAFAGLHRNWGRLRDEYAAIGYLRTAVVNGSRSVLRRRRTARDYVPPHQVNARSAESLAMLSVEHQAVVDALGGLAPRQREVLVLRYYGGLSEAEIAEATGISKGAVKSTASRALDSVADILARAEGRMGQARSGGGNR